MWKRNQSMFYQLSKSKYINKAIFINPDAKDLAEIAIDTAKSARKFGIDPRVAMLSFSTKGSAKHPFVDKVKEAFQI